jgi:hypothetical protein
MPFSSIKFGSVKLLKKITIILKSFGNPVMLSRAAPTYQVSMTDL